MLIELVKPGPLKDLTDVLFALSKEALKTYVYPYLSQTDLQNRAISKQVSFDSITHGPAIINLSFIIKLFAV
jgi:hypothetical protein